MSTPTDSEERDESPRRSRDEAYWASSTGRLSVTHPPEGAINLNVDGKMVVSPMQGFGKMWQKTYRVRIDAADATPARVIQEWKANFPKFWPAGNHFYGPITGIAPGEVGLISLSLPGKVKLSTGVLVLYADDESFTLMTPQGHVFAGWITFRAFEEGGATVAEAQVLMRANDPIYELGFMIGFYREEDRFWEHTLTQVAAHFGVDGVVDTKSVCIDGGRQWRNFGNVWHNASIRTTLYRMTLPPRIVFRSVRARATARSARHG
jgi:hypothetical protein